MQYRAYAFDHDKKKDRSSDAQNDCQNALENVHTTAFRLSGTTSTSLDAGSDVHFEFGTDPAFVIAL